jgi:hypothetical protein
MKKLTDNESLQIGQDMVDTYGLSSHKGSGWYAYFGDLVDLDFRLFGEVTGVWPKVTDWKERALERLGAVE